MGKVAGDKVRELRGSHITWDCSPLAGTLAFILKEREMGCNQEKAGTYTLGRGGAMRCLGINRGGKR